MIKSFKDRETKKVFHQQFSLKLPPSIQRIALRKLLMLNNSTTINDLRIPPANHLEQLRGDRVGQYSIRVNNAYRICFEFVDGDAFNVEIVNYHS